MCGEDPGKDGLLSGAGAAFIKYKSTKSAATTEKLKPPLEPSGPDAESISMNESMIKDVTVDCCRSTVLNKLYARPELSFLLILQAGSAYLDAAHKAAKKGNSQ